MTVLQMHNRDGHPCPDCGIGILKAELVRYFIPFDSTKLSIEHMAMVCQNPECHCILCDYRAEAARLKAVHAYVTSRHTIQGANEPFKPKPDSPEDPRGDNKIR